MSECPAPGRTQAGYNAVVFPIGVSMRIDFISDVACPWCAVGLNALERALEKIGGDIQINLVMQPFELNPDMGPEGQDTKAYLTRKYGLTPAQLEANRANIRERGAAVGFSFGERTRIWNTFDAHRLLQWAGEQGPEHQRALKHALLKAYHGQGLNPGAPEVLLEAAIEAGLDAEAAKAVIHSDQHAGDVRAAEQFWQSQGISAVPSVVINQRHLIQGGQPPEVFEQALRQIAATEGSQ